MCHYTLRSSDSKNQQAFLFNLPIRYRVSLRSSLKLKFNLFISFFNSRMRSIVEEFRKTGNFDEVFARQRRIQKIKDPGDCKYLKVECHHSKIRARKSRKEMVPN
ncbi:hypothetical protein TNIN_437031 [Trichonephila inaurata madagascariensis]|uniref:Uncharacterized protein n=1 Tax=Trichonephila inaurata madagascariensis TaxID=2747483 RepID=A0A8X6YM40_9ARAC|nr:hypothetical protein TNIN_437031 [Trichonephila inaurata madagascariensis]